MMLRSRGVKGRVMAAVLAAIIILSPFNALMGDDPGIGGSDEGAGVGRSCIIFAMVEWLSVKLGKSVMSDLPVPR